VTGKKQLMDIFTIAAVSPIFFIIPNGLKRRVGEDISINSIFQQIKSTIKGLFPPFLFTDIII